MKTFRTTGLICLLAALSIVTVKSQPVRTTHQSEIAFILPCPVNQIVRGDLTYEKITWIGVKPDHGKIQLRFEDCVLQGSNTTYSLSFSPYNLIEGNNAGKASRTITVSLDGKVIARLPVTIMFTDDGGLDFEINTNAARCF